MVCPPWTRCDGPIYDIDEALKADLLKAGLLKAGLLKAEGLIAAAIRPSMQFSGAGSAGKDQRPAMRSACSRCSKISRINQKRK